MRAEPFQVDLGRTTSQSLRQAAHSTEKCKTTFPTGTSVNPITGLIIHPVSLDTASPPTVPFYTAVRLSATATNPTWWESNLPRRPNGSEEPQWATAIQERINIQIPFGMLGQIGNDADADNDDPESYGVFREAENDDNDDEDNNNKHSDDEEVDEEDEGDSDAEFDPWAKDGPEVHPWRMRLWGIAISPGGGATAVLATRQLTQKPEIAAWSHHRSKVLFEFTQRQPPRRKKPALPQLQSSDPDAMDVDQENEEAVEEGESSSSSSMMDVEGLTTEARLWEWMYGGGPSVPGLTPLLPDAKSNGETNGTGHGNSSIVPQRRAQETVAKDDAQATTARREKIRDIFQLFVDSQTCAICADGQTKLVPVPMVGKMASGDGQQDDGVGAGAGANASGKVGGGDGAIARRHLDFECEHGHRVAVCGASGLAIMEPGISRACGVCGSRCLKVDFLVDRVLIPADRNGDAEYVRREMPVEVCARCGGKWLD